MKRLVVALGLLSGCSTMEPEDDGTLFLAQAVSSSVHMDALFQGTVTIDENGCYRLGLTGQPATMVWPFGYRLINTIEGDAVVNQDGNEIGRIGGEFAFGGGLVATVPAGLVQPESRRARAATRCPGSFWIAWPLTR